MGLRPFRAGIADFTLITHRSSFFLPVILQILQPGVLATIQDLGRPGWQSSGVPAGGASDTIAHRLANFLVGNPAGAATLEIAGSGWSARVEKGGRLSCMNGNLYVDRSQVPSGRSMYVSEGAILEIGFDANCMFSYLATPGGWDVPIVLDSASTCLSGGFGGFEGRRLQTGDCLCSKPDQEPTPRSGHWISSWYVQTAAFLTSGPADVVRVLPGAEWDWWSPEQQSAFLETDWKISSQRDRMGILLKGDALFGHPDKIMLSGGTTVGAIQVPHDGRPILLGVDAQTTGGYPRIAQVIAADLSRIAQWPTGGIVHFEQIALPEAEYLFLEQERQLARVQTSLQHMLQPDW